jgi:phenylpropionate dioxygenase-like ring-hydroxylating dioxygenase large terminal subunit
LTGRLKDVPAATKGALPKRPVVDTYHVEEKGGYVWLFFGSK